MDSNKAVKIGDLEKNLEAIKVVRPEIDKESFTNTAKVEAGRWGPLPKWTKTGTLSAKPSTRASREQKEENLYCKLVDMNLVVNVRHPSGSSWDKTLRERKDARERCDVYYDQSCATKIERREEVRSELWSAHLKSQTFALLGALRRVDLWDEAGSSPAGGSRS